MKLFLPACALLMSALLTATPDARAQATGTLSTLRSFNGPSGQSPDHALTQGNDGNFYGVTPNGGANGEGVVFRVTPAGAVTVLHTFTGIADGSRPECKLLLANDGNFYGTTESGGPVDTSGSGDGYGEGTVFQITPAGVLTVLHTFYGGHQIANGYNPESGLIQGSDGLLYGTTAEGGGGSDNSDGTLFQISLDGTVFNLLHEFDFHQTGIGGYSPNTPLVQGGDGAFYGAANGGDNGVGTIFRVTAGGAYSTLYSFNVTDGADPVGGLVANTDGLLYGMTSSGGQTATTGYGTVFKITTGGTLTTIHRFTSPDAGGPSASGFIRAADGNFYATTTYGGANGYGDVFQCTPAGVLTDVYHFLPTDGIFYPTAALTQAASGIFYGVTSEGGASQYGAVFQLVVTPHPPFFNGETDLSNGVEYLQFSTGNPFGYFSYLSDPHYLYHFDLGYEYVFNAEDSASGVYLYDFKSNDFFYTSPTFPFPYLYDFNLQTTLYYYPDPSHPGHYNTDGTRYFFDFATGKIISK